MLIWGFSWPSAKAIASDASHQTLVFLRFFPSFIGMVFIVIYKKIDISINFKNFFLLSLCGAIIALYNSMFFSGLKFGFATIGGILVTSLIPVFTFLILFKIKKFKIRLKEKIGLFSGLLGGLILIKIWDISFEKLLLSGNLFFIIAALLWATLTILSQKTQKEVHPFVFSFYVFGIASLIYFFLSFSKDLSNIASYSSKLFWLNIFYLSIVTNVFATTIYFIGTSKIGSKKASSFIFLVPIISVSSSVLLLKETIEIITVIGGFFSIFAVLMINGK